MSNAGVYLTEWNATARDCWSVVFCGLRDVNPGFDAQNVLTTNLGLARAKYPDAEKQARAFSEIVAGVGSAPSVEAAAVIFPLPFSGTSVANTFLIDGRLRRDRRQA